MLELFPHLEGALLIISMLGLFHASITILPSFDLITFHGFLLKQSDLLSAKAGGEALSYGYFTEVNENFDPDAYSDEQAEQWDVPAYFSYPQGGTTATCASVEGSIGCTVWNLDNGGDVCPQVMSYTPNPNPEVYIYPDEKNVEESTNNALTTLFQDVENILLARGIRGSVVGSMSVSSSGNTYTGALSYSFEGNGFLLYSASRYATWEIKPFLSSKVMEAFCVCDGKVVATYDVNSIFLVVEGNMEGVPLLKEEVLFLRYFLQRKSYNPPASVSECKMVFT